MCKISCNSIVPVLPVVCKTQLVAQAKKYDKMGAHSKITGQKYLPVGINAESWTENMGISHEYHSAPRRRTRGGISGKLRLAGVIVAILLVAYAVTAILEKEPLKRTAPRRPAQAALHRTFWHRCPCRARRLPAAAARVQPIAAARHRRYSWKASAPPGRPMEPIPLRRMTPVLSGSRPAVR